MLLEPATKALGARSRWGGVTDPDFRPTGYFRIAERGGIFWLIDPDGARFLSKGLNTVRIDQDAIQHSSRTPYAEACQRKYGSKAAWQAAVAGRLARWGFNTLGAWSDEAVAKAGSTPLALTPNLDLGMSFAWGGRNAASGDQQAFPDVFDAAFERHLRHRVQALCGPRRDDQAVIGWFIDNELRWGPDWRGPDELLTIFVSMPPASAGRVAAHSWLRERHPDFQEFNEVWHASAGSWNELACLPHIEPPYRRKPPYQRSAQDEDAANRRDRNRAAFTGDCDAFAAVVADRYFALTGAAIKAADPHHLVLGCRFAFLPPLGVMDAAARHTDVMSFNCYGLDPSKTIDAFAASGKPCLIGEFSFRGADSGLPNTNGAGPVLATQTRRADCFRHYVAAAVRKPALIGYHWFEHADQPAEGRFDGENSNFGTVTIADDVYEELTLAMTAINGEAEARHAAGAHAGQPLAEGAG
jgi:agarase